MSVDPFLAPPVEAAAPAVSRAPRGTTMAILLVVLAILGMGLVLVLTEPAARGDAAAQAVGSAARLWQSLAEEFLLNPFFYLVFVVVIVLERLIPARPQPATSLGLRQDLVWIPLKLVANATVLPLYTLLLAAFYHRYLGFLTVKAVASWPGWARVVLAVVVVDFLFWFSHYVRHKVKTLWYFHAIHHSQKELNFFTEYRVHPVDDLFVWTTGFVPLFMFSDSFVTVVAIVWIRHWHTRLYHSNIRSDFGWLRYVLVTPQSHRVHHSIERRHFDRNFGLTLSVWDHLFGTQYRGYDEYPETGIPDGEFPFEQAQGMRLGGLSNLLEQLLYPFRVLARG